MFWTIVFSLVSVAAILASIAFLWLKKQFNTQHVVPDYDVSEVEGEKGRRLVRQGLSAKKARELPQFDSIVVGSGIGGLTAAALLSRTGEKVLVLEQHDVAGGCTHVFEEGGFEFDTGLHYLGAGLLNQKKSSRKIFDALTGGKLQFAPMHDDYDVAVIGDKKVGICGGANKLKARLKELYPDQAAGIDEYISLLFSVNKSSQMFFVLKLIPRWLAKILSPFLTTKFFEYADKTVEQVLKPMLKDPDLIALVTYLAGDYGLPPSQASFFMHATTAHHYLQGACYPIGGSEMIARHAVKVIKAAGGKVHVRSRVKSLLVEGSSPADAKCVGVVLDKEDIQIRAPKVISNATVPVTFLKLLPRQFVPKEVIKALEGPKPTLRPSTGHLSLFVGLRGNAKQLGIRASNFWCFPSGNFDTQCKKYNSDPTLATDFAGVFISFPSTKDPTWESRYPGKSTCAVIAEGGMYDAYVKWADKRVRHRGDDYQAMKDELSQRLLEKLYQQFPQLRERVEFVELGTPLSNDHYLGAYRGASYGMAHNPERWHEDWLRPATQIKGLYLAGQDVVSAGVCGGLMGGVFGAGAASFKCLVQHLKLL